MIKICFVSLNAYKVFNPASSANIGGTELQMHAIATELAKHSEHKVFFIVGDFGQRHVEQIGDIAVYSSFSLQKSTWNLLRAPLMLWRVLFQIRPDVIVSSPAGPEVGLLALYAKIMGIRYIFRTASDVDCTKKKEKDMGIVSGFLYRIGIRMANTIITQHAQQQKDLQKYYHRESAIIKNGYDAIRPSPFDKLKVNPRTILWIGSSRTVKRPDIFFATAEHFPDYDFAMILSRSGDANIFASCEARAKTLPNVRFLGELLPKETNTVLEQSRLLLGTSDYEGSPNTYISAMMRGVPIVSLNVPCEGVCAKGDVTAMYSAIPLLMQDDVYHKQLAETGRSYAIAHHDMQRVIEDWISVIRTTNYSE